MVATDSPPVTLTGKNGNPVRARLVILTAVSDWQMQAAAEAPPEEIAKFAAFMQATAPKDPAARDAACREAGLADWAQALRIQSVIYARAPKPLSALHGLSKAIAANQMVSGLTVKPLSAARPAKPISQLHGLQKAIAAHQADQNNKNHNR